MSLLQFLTPQTEQTNHRKHRQRNIERTTRRLTISILLCRLYHSLLHSEQQRSTEQKRYYQAFTLQVTYARTKLKSSCYDVSGN